MAQLRCSDVTLGYEGTAVMEHLSFSVSAGDYLYIVGENGSGKSTLMKAILGLKSPMAGKIETGDGLKPDEIGYLPQQTAVQRDFPASVLVLDEPVTGLDPKAQTELYELIAKLNREDGITILMVSHDMEAAVKYASHVLHISKTPLFFGTKADYLRSRIGQAYTGGVQA